MFLCTTQATSYHYQNERFTLLQIVFEADKLIAMNAYLPSPPCGLPYYTSSTSDTYLLAHRLQKAMPNNKGKF
jgi:hypothetical protein